MNEINVWLHGTVAVPRVVLVWFVVFIALLVWQIYQWRDDE